MARLMLRGPSRSTVANPPAKKTAVQKPKLMASPMTIIKASAPTKQTAPIKLSAPKVSPVAPKVAPAKQTSVPSFTERLQSMAAKMNKPPQVPKDLKPEPPSPIIMNKRKVPTKRSTAIRKTKKTIVPKKK